MFGSSAYFDGTGDFLTVPTNPAHASFGTSDFVVEGWFYFNTISGTQLIFSHRNGSSGTGAYVPFLLWQTNGTINLYASSDNASWNVVNGSSPGTLVAGQWYHIAYTRTGTVFRVFINGIQTYTYGSVGSLICTQPFQIGMTGPGETNTALNGYVTDVRITKGISPYSANFVPPSAPLQAVQNTTLLLNMDKSAIQDKSGKVVLETVGDAKVSTSVKKYGSSSLYFDGSGDYLTFPSNPQYAFGTGDFTVECWVNSADVSTAQKGFIQTSDAVGGLSTGYATGITFLFGARQNGSGAASLSGAVLANIAGTNIGSSAAVVTANTWTHLALVRASGTVTIYVDGVSVGSGTAAGNCSGTNLVVGGYYSTGYLYNGYIDDLRITRGYARYTADFTPPAQALLTK